MILTEIFGDTTRVKILEEFISNWGIFLKVSEVARMSNVSEKSVYTHIKQLDDIELLEKIEGKSTKYMLKEDDKRALNLSIIDNAEYIRKDRKYSFHNVIFSKVENKNHQNIIPVNKSVVKNKSQIHFDVNFSKEIQCGGK
ncbi:hypothetical protein ALNOE001_04430 [Candidatus Methanobinarius endosymbioticus]|uniref:HTH arsR-type domain-containing protein n=1 Tax=Candidatus Methanobinarius endosymbioticus TaxID=2006182 RepID=A0A366MEF2_9EURY|nr:hypothetical protein ALNOE001_04430 [Candidatus Methanobinarius endosymbioticus]